MPSAGCLKKALRRRFEQERIVVVPDREQVWRALGLAKSASDQAEIESPLWTPRSAPYSVRRRQPTRARMASRSQAESPGARAS